MSKILDIMQGPQEAIDNINGHNHADGLGQQIPTEGLADKAVTGAKIANEAIVGDHIEDGAIDSTKIRKNSITADRLAKDLNLMAGENLLGITNYIAEGMKILPDDGLQCKVDSGRSSIEEKILKLKQPYNVDLSPCKATLIYAQQSSESDEPIIGKVETAFPDVEQDVTVVRYLFNQKINDSVIADTSGNSNDLTIYGGCTLVDGYMDKAILFDGSTGYMQSKSNVNFPDGAKEREIVAIFTAVRTDLQCCILNYGQTDANALALWINAGRFYIGGGCTVDTGYSVEAGKTYFVSLCNNGNESRLYLNGICVFTEKRVLNTTLNANNFLVCKYTGGAYYSKLIMHYIEIKNKCRTSEQIAKLANTLLFPCNYVAANAQYPMFSDTDKMNYHEWKFDESSEANITDSNALTPIIGVGVGVPLVIKSVLGLGNARKFSGTNYINCGKFTFQGEVTILGVVTLDGYGSKAIIGNHNGTNGLMFNASDANNKISLWSQTNGWQVAPTPLPLNIPAFVCITVSSGVASIYSNSPIPEVQIPYTIDTINNNNLQIGAAGQNSYPFTGTMDYLALIPRKLQQIEISQIYNILMQQVKKNIITDILPENSIGLGFVRTNSNKVIEVNDSSYKYGRKEGAVVGNRQVFLGWKWVTAGGIYLYDHPFGTKNIKTTLIATKDINSYWQNPSMDMMYNSSNSGVYGPTVKGVTCEKVKVAVGGANGWWSQTTYDDGGYNAFYLGVLAEVIE